MEDRIDGLDEAHKIIRANMSPRAKRLNELERWVNGSQYDGLCSWWNDDVPLWERAPCIVYPIVSIAIASNCDLVFGEGRFPGFSTNPGEDEEDEGGLGEDDSAAVDSYLSKYHDISQFRAFCREGFAAAQGCGTAVTVHGVRSGKPFNELHPAKWCEPVLDVERRVEKLVIQYPYTETYREGNTRRWKVRVKLYRREIDASSDVTMLPGDANIEGVEPKWQADPKQTFKHGLGFCPVTWYAFMRGCQAVNVFDGRAIHERHTDEIRQHDIAVSQRHRGALLSEPQVVEIGVSDDHNPTGMGRTPVLHSSEQGDIYSSAAALNAAVSQGLTNGAYGSPIKMARKKGPGYVWRYPNENTKVDFLEYSGDALKAQDDNAKDLLQKIQESLAVVFLDPENIKFASTTSGKALEAIKQRQIDRCNVYRDDLRDGFLLPNLEMQLRITAKLGGKITRVPGAKKIASILNGQNARAAAV